MKTEKIEHKAFTIEDVPAIGLTGRQVTLNIFALSVLKDRCDNLRLHAGLVLQKDYTSDVTVFASDTMDIINFIDKITLDIDNIHDVADEFFGVDVKDEYNDEFKRELKK